MYLSKLDIVGFKSFANKIHVKFDAGITAIVGPNGCGKTNVVDAIRWALGEQKPSMLRSDKMEDVIFNGTKNRKPTGMADVSITIENTKGILPLEYSEVTITRRVYRSGESEYYLNNTLCRLKDIKDLFMDTGMGSDAYSVIELKMIETILSDKMDERRRLFEEAAGVTKYKHRRKETYRRLESVQQDLMRVNDIVKEVQKAVNSLERQAQKAEQFNLLSEQLRVLEIQLLEREYASLITTIEPLKSRQHNAMDEKTRINLELFKEEELLESLRSGLTVLEEQQNAIQTQLVEQQQKINLAQQQRVKNSERQNALNNSIQRYENDKIDLRQQQQELEQRVGEIKTTLEKTNTEIHTATEYYSEKKKQLDEFNVQLDAKRAEVKSHQDAVIALLHTLSSKRQQYERAKARIENIHGRIEYSTEENELNNTEIVEHIKTVAQLTSEDKELRKQFIEAEMLVRQTETQKNSLQQEIEKLREQELETRSTLERKRSRLDFLKSLVENYDGLSEGTKFLLNHNEWKNTIQNTVAELITSNPQHRIAIENALGDFASYVVVFTIQDAYRGIEFLKQQKKGKAKFICLEKIPTRKISLPSLSGEGIIGWAKELVQCDSQYSNLCNILFADTIIVKDIRSAEKIIQQNSQHTFRCVTLEGEIITANGMVEGGNIANEDGGMLGKKKQIAELEKEIATLQQQLAELRQNSTEKEKIISTLDIKALTTSAKTIEQKMTSVEMKIAQIEYEKKRLEDTIQRNAMESAKMIAEVEQLQKDLNTVQPEVEKLEQEKSLAEQRSGATHSELETMEVLWNEYSRVSNDAHLEVVRLENEERNLAKELEYTAATVRNIETTFQQRDVDIINAKKSIEQLVGELQENEGILETLNAELRTIVEKKKTLETELTTKRNKAHSIELKIKDERQLHESSLSTLHELEMKISELTMKSQNLVTRAKEEFGFELVLKEFSPEEPFDIENSKEEAKNIKEKIRSLGAVNFAAFDEFQTEKQRLEFLTAQRDDLIESEKTLLTTIEEINTTATNAFSETFTKIRENFIMTFKSLFDEGDECDLKLEDGVDPLEARVEIVAKPRGKRPTSIDLLSGGEKTLTAIALLFAIYLVKPSPFCILDEVDAPLDDSNIDRYARIIRKFSTDTQFIIVTHNKRTMESANAMYGVTMEEEGVSKLVSVRFNENKVA